ncbi:unnamed protein product [Ilex paraguariensis]|uniref:Uncharacterized protein n=1 Tax=Ilex paraguariensis TaxID=185542 RepID=A0ABC8T6X6_9AQUA
MSNVEVEPAGADHSKVQDEKGTGSSSVPSRTGLPTAKASHTGSVVGGGKDGVGKCSELGTSPANVGVASLPEMECTRSVGSNTLPESENKCNVTSDSLPETERAENVASSSMLETGSSCDEASVSHPKPDSASNVSSFSLPNSKSMHRLNATPSNESQKDFISYSMSASVQ